MARDSIRVLAGPARSGKTTHLLQRYRRVLSDAEPGTLLWLAPTALAARQVRRRLLHEELRACFEPRIWTFDQFVHSVLDASGQLVRRLTEVQCVEILRHLLVQLHARGELRYLGRIVHSSGTASWVARFIRELKHHEIWPEHFRRACETAGRLSPKDHDVWLLYQRYQQFLEEGRLYDSAGAYWQARTLLQDGQQQPVGKLRLLVVDGFTDFTHTQQEILQELFQRSQEAWVSLPLERDSARPELFARSRNTWEQFLRRQGAQLVEQPARTSGWAAMDYLQQQLFVPEAEPFRAEEPARITLTAAPGVTHEVKQVARQIKHLLVCGSPEGKQRVSPGQVLVIARNVESLAELIRQEFAEAGVPVFLEVGIPLSRSGLGQVLLQLVQLVESGEGFAEVMAFLGNSSLRPPRLQWDPETARTVRQAVRRCQVPQGLKRLLQAYQRLLDHRASQDEVGDLAEAAEASRSRRDWDPEHLQAGRRLLGQLHEALAAWSEPAPLQQWLQRLETTLHALGLHPEKVSRKTPGQETDRRVWQLLRDELLALDHLLERTAAREYHPQEFLATLRDLLQQLTYQPPCVPDACVRVVSAIHARGASYPWVFVVGLSEESFPSPQDRPAVYSLAQRRQLRQRQLALPVDEDHHQGEMILFYEVLTRAEQALWLSYPALNEKAEPLLPSPYLQEVQRLLDLQPDVPEELSLVQLPRDDRAINARERWLLAVDKAQAEDLCWLHWSIRQGPPELVAQLFRSWQCVRQRGHYGHFGPWEGVLELDPALQAVQRYWTPESTVSVTSLESYAYCPWRFLMERFLDVQPLEEPAEELETVQLGLLFHDLMARGHRQCDDLQQLAQLSSAEFLQQWAPWIDEVLEAHFGPAQQRSEVMAVLASLAREDLRSMLVAYREQLVEYLEALRKAHWTELPRPAHLEVSFGLSRSRAGSDAHSTEQALVLRRGRQRLRLSGRVDRVDVGRIGNQQVALVIDYKTGSSRRLRKPRGEEPLPTALQLDLYPEALEQAVFGKRVRVVKSGYWSVRPRRGGKGFLPFALRYRRGDSGLEPDEQWKNRWKQLQQLVFRLWQGMRSGQFVVFSEDDECTNFCPLKHTCRIAQVRSLEKTWKPPEL